MKLRTISLTLIYLYIAICLLALVHSTAALLTLILTFELNSIITSPGALFLFEQMKLKLRGYPLWCSLVGAHACGQTTCPLTKIGCARYHRTGFNCENLIVRFSRVRKLMICKLILFVWHRL